MYPNPFRAPEALLEPSAHEAATILARLRERDLFLSWVLLIVVGGITGAMLGGVLGAFIGGVGAAMGASNVAAAPYITVVSLVAGLAMSYSVFRLIVKRLLAKALCVPAGNLDAV